MKVITSREEIISGKHYQGCVVYSGLTASSSSDLSAWRF